MVKPRCNEIKVFDDPWAKIGNIVCLNTNNEISEQYLTCPICLRTVIRRCPKNKWHSYVRTNLWSDGEREEICITCFEKLVFDKGIPRKQFLAGIVDDYYFKYSEMEANRYRPVKGKQDCFINGKASVEDYCKHAMKVIDAGYQVITEYERIGIGSSEGYVSMWQKKI